MKHPGILNEICNTQWAMKTDAFDGMLAIIEGQDADRNAFHSLDESSKIEAFTGQLGEPIEGTELTRINENIGYLDIDGPIVHRASGVAKVSGLTSIQGLTREFQALADNPELTDIVMLLDTPGGVVKGASELCEMIARSDKKVTAYVWGTAASLGYWIASSADQVISSNTGIVGSIGVVMTYSINKSTGIGKIISSQSPNKQMDPGSAKGKKSAQKIVDHLAGIFIAGVAKGRGVTEKKVISKFGGGDVFVAADALKLGMIDKVQSLTDLNSELMNMNTEAEISTDTEINEPENILTCEQPTAGTSTSVTAFNERGRAMTLKELMAEHSEIKSEIEAIKNESFKTGAESVQSRVNAVVAYYNNDQYPKAISNLCVQVLKNEQSKDALIGAVTVFDAQKEYDKKRGAVSDDQDLGTTQSQQPLPVSDDGIVRSAADEQAMLDRLGSVN